MLPGFRRQESSEGKGRVIPERQQGRAVPRLDEARAAWSSKTARREKASLTVSVEEARKIILDAARPLGSESVPVLEAFDRVLYEDVISDTMVPSTDDSAMDGYAVIAEDTFGASRNNPVALRVVGEARAGGSRFFRKVSRGTAIRIMTGAPIPQGADSVIRFEETDEEGGYVRIFSESAKRGNCKCAGESIAKGETVLRKGDRLKSADVGILVSLDHDTVRVYKQPTVSIISTGDELTEIGEGTRIGQTKNVNAYTLYSETRKYNAIPQYLGIARDTIEDVKEKLLKALESDVVISTGGVSMGKYDLVKQACSELDIEILFESIRVKPGRPCTFGTKDGKLIFGLPGYPVPTLTSFIQFVRPALLRLMGAKRIDKPTVNAVLEEDVAAHSGSLTLLRGCFTIKNGDFYVSTTGSQKSSVLRSMSKANFLIVIPETSAEMRAGERVAIQLIDHEEI
jgi:molybdopterin molybdotransferase